jgi:hypothetical protein
MFLFSAEEKEQIQIDDRTLCGSGVWHVDSFYMEIER